MQAGEVGWKGGLGADALALLIRIDGTVVLATGKPRQAGAVGAEASEEVVWLGASEIAHGLEARVFELPRGHCADPRQYRDRPRRQQGLGLGRADDREAARLVQVGGDLGQEAVRRQADRDRDPYLALDGVLKSGQGDGVRPSRLRRRGAGHTDAVRAEQGRERGVRRAVQALGAGEIEPRFIQRQALN